MGERVSAPGRPEKRCSATPDDAVVRKPEETATLGAIWRLLVIGARQPGLAFATVARQCWVSGETLGQDLVSDQREIARIRPDTIFGVGYARYGKLVIFPARSGSQPH